MVLAVKSIERISVTQTGTQANYFVEAPVISPDGTKIIFNSGAYFSNGGRGALVLRHDVDSRMMRSSSRA